MCVCQCVCVCVCACVHPCYRKCSCLWVSVCQRAWVHVCERGPPRVIAQTVTWLYLTTLPCLFLCSLKSSDQSVKYCLSACRPEFQFSCGRSSAIWSVSSFARGCRPRPRTISLSEPKRMHPDYRPGRPTIQSTVSNAARTYSATDHIDCLAAAKKRPVGPFRDPEWEVSKAAKQASPSDRVGELSKAKKLPEGYAPCRSVLWRVTSGAKNAVASTRMEGLAKPIIRETMDHVQFNPDAFNVSETAKKYKASARVEELAKPLQRGAT